MLQIIVKGKLDYAEGSYLIRPEDGRKYYLSAYIHDCVGKTIVISLEEEEPILNHSLKELLVPA